MEFWSLYKKVVLTFNKHLDIKLMLAATIAVTILSGILGYVYTKYKIRQLAQKREAELQRMSKQNENKNKNNDGEPEWVEDINSSYDALEYCGHLQSKFKETKQKLAARHIEKDMTVDQREREGKVQEEQLAAIFNLMQEQEEKFGVKSMDDMADQMRLYTTASK